MNDPTAELDGRTRSVGDERAAPGPSPRAARPATADAEGIPGYAHGKTAVVTGANRGVGYHTARHLAASGATVVLTCRHPGRMADAAQSIRAEFPGAVIDEVAMDLGSLRSVRAAARRISEGYAHVDILINNAGLMGVPEWRTLDGVETHFGVNHLGHFALTGLLLDALLEAPDARIVTVTSPAHRAARLDPTDWPHPRVYNPYSAYAASKLANLLFAYQLHDRITATGAAPRSIACHPGWSATQLVPRTSPATNHRASMAALRVLTAIIGQSPQHGARPSLLAATADVPSGAYLEPTRLWRTRGPAAIGRSSSDSYDSATGRLLWDLSVELSGVDYASLRRSAAVDGRTVLHPESRALGRQWEASNHWAMGQAPLVLPDGTELSVRPAAAEDLAAVVQLHDDCSERSRHQRYLGGSMPSPNRLRRLLEPGRGTTLLAVGGDRAGTDRQVIAMANLVAEGHEAEAALLVRDDWQRRGVGSALLRRLLEQAERNDCSAVLFHAHAQNVPMLRTIARIGRRTSVQRHGSSVTVTLQLKGIRSPVK
ncbi:oxidoreductase [Micromonospora profundi]|uniref:oxidoreductase n=1 Tax=Micromonospora profundi TaxID=1420889 RepID=UPI00365048EC